eukprot:62629_1
MAETSDTTLVDKLSALQTEYQTLCNNFNISTNKRILSCITNAMQTNSPTIHFNLSSPGMHDIDKINDAEIIPLFEAIKTSNCIDLARVIDLSWNKISDASAKSIASLLINNQYITDLNLKGNDITSVGAFITSTTRDTQLKSLNLNGNPLGDDTIVLLSELLTNTNYKNLRSLDIGNCDFGHVGWTYIMTRLAENQTLQALNIQNCRITTLSHEMCSILSKVLRCNQSLTTLNISCQAQGIGDDGMKWIAEALKGNHVLETLDLSCNSIGCDGVMYLATETCSLKYLSLRGNRLTDIGARYICKIIESNESLQYLDLRSTNLKDDGLYLIAETVNNVKNESNDMVLQTILLDDNEFGSKAAAMWRTVLGNPNANVLDFDFWPLIVE